MIGICFANPHVIEWSKHHNTACHLGIELIYPVNISSNNVIEQWSIPNSIPIFEYSRHYIRCNFHSGYTIEHKIIG